MNQFINWLLGLDPTTEILNADISFRYPIPAWLVAGIIILIGVYCHWVYKKETPETGGFYRGLLAFFRFIIWTAVFLVILQPRLDLNYLSQPKSNLAILIDTSKSMGLSDKSNKNEFYSSIKQATTEKDTTPNVTPEDKRKINDSTRYEILGQILSNEKLNLIKRLEEDYAVHIFGFDERAEKIQLIASDDSENPGAIQMPELTGDTTQLGSALRSIPNKLRGLPITAVVPFTDGANNRGESSATAAQWLGERDIPVYPVGIGAPEAVDVGIINIDLPDLLFKDDEIAVRITFEASSLEDVVLPITLMLGEKEVGTGEVVARNGTFQTDIVFTPKEVGDLVFKVDVPQQADEVFIDNNVLKKRVRVIDSAIRILIAVDTPSWEYRYLKGFLATDDRIHTKTFIRRGDIRTSSSNPEYLPTFPTYDEMNKYDCVIFNNITADYFSDDQMRDIVKYVSEDGGSFILISSTKGTPGTFIGTPIGDMLPVTLNKISEDPNLDLQNHFTNSFKLRLTRDGYSHIITRLHPIPEKNAEVWGKLPGQLWYYTGIKRLKPAALALVEHASKRNEYGPIPLMAWQRYGRGNVLFNGINSIWRWRYKIGNKFSNRFWGQTIQYMGLPHLLGNMKRVNFQTTGRDFTIGEKIPVTARVLDRDFRPITSDEITILATEENTGNELDYTFAKEEGKEGTYSGKLFLQEGTWHIVVQDYEKEEELVLDISPPQFEFESPAMRIKELQTVADASGGAYVGLEELHKLPEMLKGTAKKMRSQMKRDLWDTWLSLLLITIACAIEWILRKRIDLA